MNILQRTICFFIICSVLFLAVLQPVYGNAPSIAVAPPDYGIMVGQWQRTDGGYLVKVSKAQADGQATVEYFNPRPIHVEQAAISTQKGLIKLFILLQDKGYQGSTYTLYYYAEKDALVGFYFQAGTGKTYEVIFTRKSVTGE